MPGVERIVEGVLRCMVGTKAHKSGHAHSGYYRALVSCRAEVLAKRGVLERRQRGSEFKFNIGVLLC